MKLAPLMMKMNKLQLYILVVFSMFCFQNLFAQSPYVFHHLNTNDGLSNTNVKAILRDKEGFLWVGTESGLNRYDGYGFKVYTMRSKKPNDLVSNNILGLQEDGLGNIWVQLENTFMLYSRDKDYFISDVIPYLKKINIPTDQNFVIHVDKKQNLWVLNNNKFFFYNVKKRTTSVYNLKEPIKDLGIITIADNGESLFYMERSGKCWKLDSNSGNLTKVFLPDYLKPNMANSTSEIYFDNTNGFWIYSGNKDQVFYRKNVEEGWETIVLKSKINTENFSITSIVENATGQVCISTDHKGLFVYDKTQKTVTNITHNPSEDNSISSNSISLLYLDDDETIWIGHNKKGLSFFNESFRNFRNFKHPEYSEISMIMEDHLENIWLGTDGKGMFLKEKQSQKTLKLPISNTSIISIIEDRKNRIWFGTYQKGLFCYDNGKIHQYTKENSKLSNNNIWSLKEDRYGNIWIGTLGSKIQVLPSDSIDFDSLLSPFEEDIYVLDMFYDGGDKMYFGTTNGLLMIDITNNKKQWFYGNRKKTQQFKQNQISNVYKDKRDIIWIGNSDGLIIWDQKKDTIYYFNKSNGLCDNSIKGIIEDDLNNMWITTSNGLSILTVKRDLKDKLLISSKNFSVKDGLFDNYFNSHSIGKLRNGNILIGNIGGYTILNPHKMVEKNRPIAKITFTGLVVGNQNIEVDSLYNGHKLLEHPMELTSKLVFRYDDKLITLRFTTTDLLNADKVKYLYRIEGFDTGWIPIQENKIVLSSLSPGDYKLLIKASNSDGVWDNNPTVLEIEVKPPFYLSVWAYIFYLMVLFGIVFYLIRRSRNHNLMKLEEQRIKINHEKEWHINEMKLKFFTNISHDLRTPLTLIITPLQVMLNDTLDENMRKKLSVIYKNSNQLESLINSLLDFRKLDVGIDTLNLTSGDFINFSKDIIASFTIYAEERTIDLSLDSELESLSMRFDKDKIQKTLTNLLSNAFKYTPDGGFITVYIKRQYQLVYISVCDSGVGINDVEKTHVFERFYQAPEQDNRTGSGIGLHIANEYVNLHGGAFTVTDNVPQGSVFTFNLPILPIKENENPSLILEYQGDYFEDNLEDNCQEITNSNAKPVLLFVDDNTDFCDFMVDNLEDKYAVITANNGQEAIEQLNHYEVSIIVSDVMMPVMDGIELCKEIKNNIYWSHIPIILLTARTAEEHQIEGLEFGADDYITKPFNMSLLRLKIDKFREWARKNHTLFSQKLEVNPSEITITSLDEKFIEKAIKIVETNINDAEFSVENLGAVLGLSRGHLYKKLMVITGKGPAEFIRTIRLKRGRQLLEESQMQISQIAYEVGFNSPKRFSKYFRDEFGLSPSEYLRVYKSNSYND